MRPPPPVLPMSRDNQALRRFARRLIDLETSLPASAKTNAAAVFPVIEKLRLPLSGLMGNGGFRALLSRALALAGTEMPWLRAVHVKADGSLEGWAELRSEVTAEELFQGSVELFAQLLGLLVAFIGEALTLRLIGEVWPKLSLDDFDLTKGD